mmetsp:Transcript_18256/g.40373  ORF Transcript_18256/g.40373 Transcript_18256/m.40373 type:complete len:265 (-) Transcript_18256:86-880(-)
MPNSFRSRLKNSMWCRVAKKTIVDVLGFATCPSTYKRAEIFCSLVTRTFHKDSCSLRVISTSRRTNSGSRNPTRVKATSCDGIVAEKSNACLDGGHAVMTLWSCSANPSSKSRSASSNTNICTLVSFRSTSIMWCIRRPGVHTMMSGFWANRSNCFSMDLPPTRMHTRRSVNLPRDRANLAVCMVNSRVGARHTALTPTIFECSLSFSMVGMRKAADFPDPVRAMATTSTPSKMRGMALRWIGVGCRYPICLMALNSWGHKPSP